MTHITRRTFTAGAAAALPFLGRIVPARAAEPITIGFSMELTGPFAVVGKTGLLAFKIWEEETNARGGLLGRPVKLVYYDDQSNLIWPYTKTRGAWRRCRSARWRGPVPIDAGQLSVAAEDVSAESAANLQQNLSYK